MVDHRPRAETKRLPEFRMPTCYRHFFTGHRWWCRACDRETTTQFREVAEALWTLQAAPEAGSAHG